MEDTVCKNNQLPTKSHVEFEDNSIRLEGFRRRILCVEMATTKTNQVGAFSIHIHPCICRIYKQHGIFLYFNANLSKILFKLDLVVQKKLKPRQVAAILESLSLLLLLNSSLSKLCTGMKQINDEFYQNAVTYITTVSC